MEIRIGISEIHFNITSSFIISGYEKMALAKRPHGPNILITGIFLTVFLTKFVLIYIIYFYFGRKSSFINEVVALQFCNCD